MGAGNDKLELIEVPIEAANPADKPALIAALEQYAAGTGAIAFSVDPELAAIVVKGRSEGQLDFAIHILRKMCAFAVNIGAPQVAYRETLARAVEIDHTYMKQHGGSGEFARVKIMFEPLAQDSGFVFENQIVGGAIPEACVPGVEAGLEAARQSGVIAGFPMIDFKATLVDGAYHEVDSNARTFEIAARAAIRELKTRRAVKLLEPMMQVEVVTPQEFLDSVVGYLEALRSEIKSKGWRGDGRVVVAIAPLSNLFGFQNRLLTLTRGEAGWTSRFERYDVVPWGDDDPGRFPPAAAMRL